MKGVKFLCLKIMLDPSVSHERPGFVRTLSLSSPYLTLANEIRARHLTASGGIDGFSWSDDSVLTRAKHSHSDLWKAQSHF